MSRQTPQQIVDQILACESESKIIVLAPLIDNQPGEFQEVIEKIWREGFVRARVDGQIIGFYVSTPIKRHEYPAYPIIVRTKARLIKNEMTDGTQTSSCQAQLFR